MTERKSVLAFAAVGLIATAALGYRAVAQNAEEAGPQDQRMMQCPMMEAFKSVQLHADSPAVLLGQGESLELTAQQNEQLQKIAAAARQQARAVLSDAQRQQLEEAPTGPLSPMELAKLQTKNDAGEGKAGMCPMCMKMMQRMKERQGGEQDDPDSQR